MIRLLNPCGNHRQSISLLGAGVLPEEDRASLETHLAACARCKSYHDEIMNVAHTLTHWERNFSSFEPNLLGQAGLMKILEPSAQPAASPAPALAKIVFDWCRDLVWPCRRIWASFAAIWLGILAVNFSMRETGTSLTMKSSSPPPELVRAFIEENFPAGLSGAGSAPGEEQPKPFAPRPNSARHLENFHG